MRAIPIPIRKRILELYERGRSTREIAQFSGFCIPIEPMWSKINQILRGHAPRSDEQLLRAAKKAFQSISVADCKGFFLSARYATS